MRFFLALLLLCLAIPASAQERALRVTIAVPLSGVDALAGQDMLDGFGLIVRSNVGRLSNVEVDVTSADLRRENPNRIIARNQPDILVIGGDGAALEEAAALAPQRQIFVLALDRPSLGLAGAKCNAWTFALTGRAELQAETVGAFLKSQGYRRVVTLAPDLPSSAQQIAAFRRGYGEETAGALVTESGQMDYRLEIQRLRIAKPDAVFLAYKDGLAVQMMRQLRQQGVADIAPIFTAFPMLEGGALDAMGAAAAGVLDVAEWSATLDFPQNLRMAEEFRSAYGRKPTAWAAFGFDAALLIEAALRKAQGDFSDADIFREALRSAEWSGARGIFKFDRNHLPVQDYHLRQVVETPNGLVPAAQTVLLRAYQDPAAANCSMEW